MCKKNHPVIVIMFILSSLGFSNQVWQNNKKESCRHFNKANIARCMRVTQVIALVCIHVLLADCDKLLLFAEAAKSIFSKR